MSVPSVYLVELPNWNAECLSKTRLYAVSADSLCALPNYVIGKVGHF